MDVSIIIVNYITPVLLKNCISSIFDKTDGVNFEIIVVDNNSNDGSEVLINDNFPTVTYIQSGSNLGFGKANNLGVRIAKGRNIFFLNSDTILLNNAVKILSDYLDKNPKVGVCGGNLYDENGIATHSHLKILPGLFYEFNQICFSFYSKFFVKNFHHNYEKHPIEVSYVTGADMMIKKSLIDIVGCFDPDFFLYYEETELQNRISKTGYKIMNVPQSKIIHLEGASSINSEWKINVILESYKLYLSKIYKFKLTQKFTVFMFKIKCLRNLFLYTIINNKQNKNYWLMNFKNIINIYNE